MDRELYGPFVTSVIDIIKEMTDVEIEGMDSMVEEPGEIPSLGISSIITFAGGKKGRLLMDMEPTLALHMANTILGEQFHDVKDHMVLSAVAEINNIVSGNAITLINNRLSMNLRLAPPVVFAGKDAIISIPKLSSQTAWGNTVHGRIRINVAWEGSVG